MHANSLKKSCEIWERKANFNKALIIQISTLVAIIHPDKSLRTINPLTVFIVCPVFVPSCTRICSSYIPVQGNDSVGNVTDV